MHPPPPVPTCACPLQYPLTTLGLHAGFTWINVGQSLVLLPLFGFAYFMYRWENADLVPIR